MLLRIIYVIILDLVLVEGLKQRLQIEETRFLSFNIMKLKYLINVIIPNRLLIIPLASAGSEIGYYYLPSRPMPTSHTKPAAFLPVREPAALAISPKTYRRGFCIT